MRAIDSNVVVRFLTADDAKQANAARKVIEAGGIFISLTVLLESEWVLRSGYGFAPGQIADGLAGLPGLTIEEPQRLAEAIEWLRAGMDFADALHLAGSQQQCDAFLTFDRKLANTANGVSPITVQIL